MSRDSFRSLAPGPTFALLCACLLAGCGTTRSSDTSRTATEQLLISDAIDRAVQNLNLSALAGQSVYLDDQHLRGAVDDSYLVSTLRQHLLASGCTLEDQWDEANYVVEARAGAIGTDRHDLLFGIPAMNLPQFLPLPVPGAIPEVPFAKRRDQRGIAKIAVFAYHRPTGKPVWQSGLATETSSSNDVWILGAGPFRHGTVYDSPTFVGRSPNLPNGEKTNGEKVASIGDEALFANPIQLATELRNSEAADAAAADAEAAAEANPQLNAPSAGVLPVKFEDTIKRLPEPAPFTPATNASALDGT